ncbi:MAG TPA: potassium-transporting ATPase subunit KdpC, partial [Clostridia bacterium]|nr:potassium-transporting ATPase subunit KdpC [Clostridia bacterium]
MKTLIRAITVSLVFIILCGIIYPLTMTGVSQLIFHKQANGSLVKYNGKTIGSELLGQAFTDMRFFHGRVSAYNYNTYTKDDTIADSSGKKAYAGVGSGSSNLAPSNPALAERVKKDMAEFLKTHPEVKKSDIPTDLLTSSGSGLDPDVSPEAANIQMSAISKATGISVSKLGSIIKKCTESRQLGIFGQPRVNILKANIEIARI